MHDLSDGSGLVLPDVLNRIFWEFLSINVSGNNLSNYDRTAFYQKYIIIILYKKLQKRVEICQTPRFWRQSLGLGCKYFAISSPPLPAEARFEPSVFASRVKGTTTVLPLLDNMFY